MEEFLLASVTWWSPGTTCHSHNERISTTDTRLAVNAGWVIILCLSPLWETFHETHTSHVSDFLPVAPDGQTCPQRHSGSHPTDSNWTCSSSQINTCYTVPCVSTGENECLWTDWLLDNSLNGEQARQYACIRRSDTTCSWYRGGSPPEKDFLDMTDPWFEIWVFILTHFRLWKSHTSCFCSSTVHSSESRTWRQYRPNTPITSLDLLLHQQEKKKSLTFNINNKTCIM